MLNAVFEKYDIFLFIVVRMTGFVFFNPIFGRRNIPAQTRVGLTLVLAVFTLMYFAEDYTPVGMDNILIFALLLMKEFVIGFLLGTIVNIVFSIASISGEIIDMQMGMSMSQMYDPGSNIQMPLSGNFYNIVIILLFFVTNSHGNLLQIVILSFKVLPVDSFYFNPAIGMYLMEMFGEIFLMSLKFALPVIAAELITETAVGIIMRAVPQINVFVVGLQLKILAGLAIMLVCAPVSVWLLDDVLRRMGENALEALVILAG